MLDVSEQGDEREWLEIFVGRMIREVSPLEREKNFFENTHQVSLGEGEYLQGQVEERGVTQGRGGGDCGSKADKGIQNSPCTHPNPGGWESSWGPGRRVGKDSNGGGVPGLGGSGACKH